MTSTQTAAQAAGESQEQKIARLLAENELLKQANARLAFVAAAAEALLARERELGTRWAWLEFRTLEATLKAALSEWRKA